MLTSKGRALFIKYFFLCLPKLMVLVKENYLKNIIIKVTNNTLFPLNMH